MFINCLPNLLLLEIDEKRQFQLELRFNTQIITTEVILLCAAIAKRARNQKAIPISTNDQLIRH